MPSQPYLTAPIKTDKMPPGVPYIVGNEAAERFSFYGLRAILMVYMTKYLVDRQGNLAPLDEFKATEIYHNFLSAVYFIPLFGAIISDVWWGKYKTILILSLVYCLGPFFLAFDRTIFGVYAGLILIAIGSGGIKPCVSAHVGDQFGQSNQHLLTKVFGWFYFSINFGSFFSTLLTPWLLADKRFGPAWAFGVPAVLMLIATWVFWLGRHKFIHIPAGGKAVFRETFSKAGLLSIAKLLPIFAYIPIFWALYDQSGSRWILQAEKMDRVINLGPWTFEILASQTHAANPILVMIYIPLFGTLLYPALNRMFRLTPLRKAGIGLFLMVLTFLISAWIEVMLGRGEKPHIHWQFLGYVVLTASEVMVYITLLEFAYTQAPKHVKSLIMSVSLLAIALGNQITALVNKLVQVFGLQHLMSGASYYLFFAGLMLVAAIGFVFVAMRYKEQTILQEEMPAAT
jgi:POT family proton-dependent oligopeptide transporter